MCVLRVSQSGGQLCDRKATRLVCRTRYHPTTAQRRHRKRYEHAGHGRYLTFSCYQRLLLFGNDKIKDVFAVRRGIVEHASDYRWSSAMFLEDSERYDGPAITRRRPRKVRSIVVRVVVFLLLGAVVNAGRDE